MCCHNAGLSLTLVSKCPACLPGEPVVFGACGFAQVQTHQDLVPVKRSAADADGRVVAHHDGEYDLPWPEHEQRSGVVAQAPCPSLGQQPEASVQCLRREVPPGVSSRSVPRASYVCEFFVVHEGGLIDGTRRLRSAARYLSSSAWISL
jgi:hypothetical protein